MTKKELFRAIEDGKKLRWNDPDPIEGADYIITKVHDMWNDSALISYMGGSEAEVYISEISIVNTDFAGFPKMGRLSREMIITEKIDGTNAQLLITEDGDMLTGSRTRWITSTNDNYGFARWAEGNKEDLLKLGPGRHFGEWWGSGIQRGYGLKKGEKRFSLFNTIRWARYGTTPLLIPNQNPLVEEKYQDMLPESVGLVPVLHKGMFTTHIINEVLKDLELCGSYASPGFMNPEGIVIFHTASNTGFKKTIKDDEIPKSLVKNKVSYAT